LVFKERYAEATTALEKLRGIDVTNEVNSLKDSTSQEFSTEGKFMDLFSRAYLKSLIIGTGLQLAQQLSGINAVFYYSTSIFHKAGINSSDIATASLGGINVISTVVAAALMDRAGRRPLLLLSQGLQIIFLILLAFSMIFLTQMGAAGGYILVISVLLFVVGFAIGMGPVPWLIISEIFPAGIRAYAVGVAVGVNWTANFLVALLFPSIEDLLGKYTFLLFAGVVIVFTVFTWFLVPETKGKSIEELSALGKKRDSFISQT